jgi:hypothetical protein
MSNIRFALAGRIVSDPKEAHRIWRAALRDGRTWIVSQAWSVYLRLKRAAEAKARGES